MSAEYTPTPTQLANADQAATHTHHVLTNLVNQLRTTTHPNRATALAHDGHPAQAAIAALEDEFFGAVNAGIALAAVAARRIVQLEQQLAEATR